MCAKWILFIYIFIGVTIIRSHDIRTGINVKDFEKNGKLIFTHVLYRHGDRTPTEQAPGDNYDLSFWPDGWGQLTNLGKQQVFALGQWLRKRYINFLSITYHSNDTYVQSSDVDRTLMSAQATLAGLYPPQGNQTWNNNMDWQPIPVHTIPQNQDYLIASDIPKNCTAFYNGYNAFLNSDEMKEHNKEMRPIYEYLTEKTGSEINNIEHTWLIRDSWLCETVHNLRLPDWAEKLYPYDEQFYQAEIKFFIPETSSTFLTKIRSGFLLKDILDRFTSKANNTLSPDRKMWMYSTHDSTIFSLLNALGISDKKLVSYAATVILELKKYKNDFFVQIFYKNSNKTPPAIHIPGCGSACPLSKMYEMYENILPKNDFNTECQ